MIARSLVILITLAAGSLSCFEASSQFRTRHSEQEYSVSVNSSSTTQIVSTFESNTTENWQPRLGSESVAITNSTSRSGSYSLLTSQRQAEYNGCKIDVSNMMTTGSRYRITVWAKLVTGAQPLKLKVSLQRALNGVTTYHTAVPNTAASDAQWVRLTAVYEYAFSHDDLFLYVESASGTASFYIDDFELKQEQPLEIQNNVPSLTQTLAGHFPVGAAVSPDKIAGGAHTQLLRKHFNSITAEDDMKWNATQPVEGAFNFGPADALVNFATANGMRVRGHALVWHEQNPDWLFRDINGNPMTPTAQNKALLLERLDNHVRTVVAHFGNSVYAWDVVNEAVDENQPDGFRRNMWFQICGPEYIDRAFLAARAASSTAKLYLNDFDTTNPLRRVKLLNLIRDLKSRAVPIDGIGHQMHIDIATPSAVELIDTVNAFSAIPGIDNQITELDMSVYTNGTQRFQLIPDEILMRQGYRYREIFDAARQLQGKVSSVTFWGLADDDTWLSTFPIDRFEAPLLFDDRLQAKPAFWGIVDPIQLAATISGRVLDPDNRGIRNATVSLVDAAGVKVSVTTGTFGNFNFNGVWRFQTYTITAASKRYRFTPRLIQVADGVSEIIFIGEE